MRSIVSNLRPRETNGREGGAALGSAPRSENPAMQHVAPGAKRRFKVLVVDDDAANLEAIEALLSADFDVASASSPEAALALLGRGSFDVVCSDYQMAGMNGLRLLELAAERWPYVGCVLVTGSNDFLRGARAESRHYVLVKPYDPARLVGIVTQLALVADTKRSVENRSSGIRLRK